MPIDVLVAGCIGIDTNVYLPGRDIDFSVEANFVESVDCVGQAGGYTARLFRQFGRRTAFAGAVGRDPSGEEVRRVLALEGIEALLFDDPGGTHRSVNFMYRDGRRKNFYDGRRQMEAVPDLAACEALLTGARLAHLHLENWCRALPAIAHRHGCMVSVDLQDVVALDDPYRREFIDGADVLFFSCVNFPDPEPAVRELLGNRPGRIVIGGRGAEGALLGTSDGVRFCPALQAPEPVLDTNGAGDALAVGFLASYVFDGFGLADAVLRGQLAARHLCSQRAGAKAVTRAEVDALHAAYLAG